jgi:thiosulfate/3-mercaptopyruvate sulfurtransferase
MNQIESRGYAHPNALVSTEWVAEHLDDPSIRILESNEDPLLFKAGHIPGAQEVDWVTDLNDPLRRDYLSKESFEILCARLGITPFTTVVFYGDKNNWWACYALWVFNLFGHDRCVIMDGGSLKWQQERRPTTRSVTAIAPTTYSVQGRNDSADRALRADVLHHLSKRGKLIDVRSPDEYSGKRLHMDGYPNEGALRGGHIPGARNVPWARAVNPETGEFRSAPELRAIYEKEHLLSAQDEVIVYCRIGERSSHTWFALKYLLGYQSVRNYDGSWTEWGNSVGVPIER